MILYDFPCFSQDLECFITRFSMILMNFSKTFQDFSRFFMFYSKSWMMFYYVLSKKYSCFIKNSVDFFIIFFYILFFYNFIMIKSCISPWNSNYFHITPYLKVWTFPTGRTSLLLIGTLTCASVQKLWQVPSRHYAKLFKTLLKSKL